MKIKDQYTAAILNNYQSLILLIDFLVYEKKVLSMEDDEKCLELYLLEKHKEKMNGLLDEYNQSRKIVKVTKEINVFQIRQDDTFYYVAAYTKEQASAFFKNEYGELHEIRIELPELEVEGEDGIHTLRHLIMKTRSFPAVLGSWILEMEDENYFENMEESK